jgi:sugar lactone lactonase YvrE
MAEDVREIRTVVTGMSFTECPRWHDDRLWFVDFYTHVICSVREDGSDLRVEVEVPAQPSGLGWLPDGRLLYVSMRDRKVMRREPDGTSVVHADVSEFVGGHPNDMVVDDAGRAWLGNFGFDLMGSGDVAPTVLLRIDPDGSVTVVADDVWFPNGSIVTPDGVLLVDETFANRVSAFDIADDGSLRNRRVFAQFAEPPAAGPLAEVFAQIAVAPDGCGYDSDGCGSPTRSAVARSASAKAARSSTRWLPAAASSRACSAAPTAAPCSSAAPPISTNKQERPQERRKSEPSQSTPPAQASPDDVTFPAEQFRSAPIGSDRRSRKSLRGR